MLRAGLRKNPSSPYICDICQGKLSIVAHLSPCHALSGPSKPRTFTPRPSSFLAAASSSRTFSTTRTSQQSDEGKGLPKLGRFPSSGGASFGAFGLKKPPSSESAGPSNGLLPHELAARQRSSKPPAKVAPQDKKRDFTPTKTFGSQQNQQSRSALASLFNQVRDRTPTTRKGKSQEGRGQSKDAQQIAKSTSTESTEQTSSNPSPPAWGAFSKRKTTTTTTRRSAPRNDADKSQSDAPGTTKNGFAARFQQATNKDGGAWSSIAKQRRSLGETLTAKPEAGADKPKDDFWDELESRVSSWRERDRAREAGRIQEAESTKRNDEVQEQEEAQPARRKSRFDVEEDSRGDRGKKSRKEQKKGRHHSRFEEEEDWDDAQIVRWEQKQRRLEEKRLRKQEQQAEVPEAVPIFIPEFISVSSLAQSLKQRQTDFLRDLEEMGFENMTNDTIVTGETAALIAMEYGFEPTVDTGSTRDLRPRPAPEDLSTLPPRPPIVTIMGHVDHGKTTLLDWLRKSSIAAQEHGGITQHIGAFVVQMSTGKRITFLDTPGHAAFLSMRQRGANVTDIVILVVAADDSVMPQTLEALKHATAAKVPIIVAINKVDKEEARVEQVKSDLARHGVEIEDYGGDVQVVCVSGKTGLGMDDLEENIVTLSEILDVRSEPDGMAEGWVLESSVKQNGKVATVLVKRGTLRPGDVIVAGRAWARIRLLRNEAGQEVDEAPPGTPVEILGWRDLPEAGEQVLQAPDEDRAKTAVDYRQEMADRQESSVYLAEQEQRQREKAAAEALAAELEEDAATPPDTPPGVIFQNYTVRADVAGSVEAVCGTIQELGNNEVQPRVLRSTTGQVSEYDIDHAAASRSIIVNFNSAVLPHIRYRAEQAGVRIIDHSVIYHLVDEVRSTLSDLLPMKISHRVLGEADVLQIFPINIRKRVFRNIAGCRIRNGSIKKTSLVKVLRRGEVVFDGKIDTLKHVKKDVMEMGKGSECGIGFEGWEDLQVDDQIQTYEILKEKRQL